MRRSPLPKRLLKTLALRHPLSFLLALALYTLLAIYLLSPKIITVGEQELHFLSTDLDSSTRASITHAIEEAKESVTLICYAIGDRHIIHALKSAADRNVTVSLVYDPSATLCADQLGPPIHAVARKSQGLMHHKLLVIDHKQVWLGSANMTPTSLSEHGNLMLAMHCSELAQQIETLAHDLLTNSRVSLQPLTLESNAQRFSLYIHPFHGRDSLSTLINKIDSARQRAFVAMYTFTHPQIVDALKRAHKRGVDVRVLFDKDSSRQTSKIAYQACKRAKIPCGYRTRKGLLHYKTALIDSTLFTGSCNWTKAGFTKNDDAIFTIDPLLPEQLRALESWWETVEHFSSIGTP